MISNRYKKFIGYGIIFSSVPFFYFYFDMTVRATIADPVISLELSLYATNLFFFGFWALHIPGFALIILGIVVLIKSKTNH